MNREREIAMMEGAEIDSEEAYFAARPMVDSATDRRAFRAGFERGWEAAAPQYPLGIPEEELRRIVDSMPGGVRGYLTEWGWLQLVRRVEKAQGIVE